MKLIQLELNKILNKLKIDLKNFNFCSSKVVLDSRNLKEGDLFVAINGYKDDGRRYINEAIKKKSLEL